MTARGDAVERARRLRVVIEECERIAADDTDPLQEQAYRWLCRLLEADLMSGYPAVSTSVLSPGEQRHTPGGHRALQGDAELEGWPNRHRST